MTVTLFENFRAVFYAPFYAALALDAFAREGVEVRFETAGAPGPTARGISDTETPLWWGGPMRILVARDEDPASALVSFCEVVTRDPFFLVGRTPCSRFSIPDLLNLRIATVSEVPTPWMCLQEDVRRAGLDPSSLHRTPDRSMAENAEALRSGSVDVVQLFEPFVEQLIRDGSGHVWYAAASRGATSYTSLYAAKSTLIHQRETVLAVVRAIYRTQKWLHAQPAASVAATIRPYFPDLEPELLTGCLSRYGKLGIWGRAPFLPREGFDRLKRSCLSGRLIGRGADYDDCVDNSLARAVIEADPSSF